MLDVALGDIFLIFGTASFLFTDEIQEYESVGHRMAASGYVIPEKSQRDQGSCFLSGSSADLKAP